MACYIQSRATTPPCQRKMKITPCVPLLSNDQFENSMGIVSCFFPVHIASPAIFPTSNLRSYLVNERRVHKENPGLAFLKNEYPYLIFFTLSALKGFHIEYS